MVELALQITPFTSFCPPSNAFFCLLLFHSFLSLTLLLVIFVSVFLNPLLLLFTFVARNPPHPPFPPLLPALTTLLSLSPSSFRTSSPQRKARWKGLRSRGNAYYMLTTLLFFCVQTYGLRNVKHQNHLLCTPFYSCFSLSLLSMDGSACCEAIIGRGNVLPLICRPFPFPLSVARGSNYSYIFRSLFFFFFLAHIHSLLAFHSHALYTCSQTALKPRAKTIIPIHAPRNPTLSPMNDNATHSLSHLPSLAEAPRALSPIGTHADRYIIPLSVYHHLVL